MRCFIAIALLGFLPKALWGATTFSALAGDPSGTFWVGLRTQAEAYSAVSSALLEIGARNFAVKRIELPRHSRDREVIAILPAGKKLVVVTQWTIEQGDNPQVLSYERARRRWTRLGAVACPGVRKMRVSPGALVFDCEEHNPEGAPKRIEKKLGLGQGFSSFDEVADLPMLRAHAKGAQGELLGDPFRAEQLRIRSASGQEKVFEAKSFSKVK